MIFGRNRRVLDFCTAVSKFGIRHFTSMSFYFVRRETQAALRSESFSNKNKSILLKDC